MKPKSRGNGQGCAYKRGNTWTACVVVGWRPKSATSKGPIPIKRTKAGFKTKKDALDYCLELRRGGFTSSRYTLKQIYDQWEAFYSPRISASTLTCYSAAFKHFSPLHFINIDRITASDLQQCMDDCQKGKTTHQNMKCLAGLLWEFALNMGAVPRDVTAGLYIGKHDTKQREPLTEKEIAAIRAAIGSIRYAEYVYALCYLGFRPGELLALKKSDYHEDGDLAYLVGGSKTDAGRGRRVPVPAQIAGIIRERLDVPGTDLLFPRYDYSRSGAFNGLIQMTHAYFRESVFKPMMQDLGIADGKVPYCARHSYSDKLKKASGDDHVKASLMGHTDYAFTQSHYQSTGTDDLKAIADTIL